MGLADLLYQEAATGVVELPEDDPDVLECFLQFLYTGTYQDETRVPSLRKGPVDVTIMSRKEIDKELRNMPGVEIIAPAHAWPGSAAMMAALYGPPPEGPDRTTSRANPASGNYMSTIPDDEPVEPEENFPDRETEVSSDEEGENISNDQGQSRLAKKEQRIRELRVESIQYPDKMRHQDLFLPLRLYVMADKFDVPALKLLARDRFFYAAEQCWMSNESFPAVVDELYTTTADTEVPMREIVCRLAGPNMHRHEQRARLEEVMRKHGDFAVAIMNHMARGSGVWG
jgi:hypothetical protein